MRPSRPRTLAGLIVAVMVVVASPAAHAQDPTADAFCALFTNEEVSGVLGTDVTGAPSSEGCLWSSAGGGFTTAAMSWYPTTIADHQAVWPDGTDLTVGGRTAWFSPGFMLQELLIELDPAVLHLVITGFDGDVEAALTELGELAVARSEQLLPPSTPEPLPVMDADPALEALFPASIGGHALVVQSVAGEEAVFDPADRPMIAAVLATLGKTFDDLSIAFASSTTGSVAAYRVAGADATAFLAPFTEIFARVDGERAPMDELTPVQIAGKEVQRLARSGLHLYPSGDVVWAVQADEPALTEILAALP